MANRAQFNRVQEMIGIGIAEGARLVCGGPGRPQGLEPRLLRAARPSSPTVHPQMRIAQEEIFGPVLAIIAYDSVDEAVEIANGTVYGLGAHVQGQDLGAARAVAARIRSGQVHINYPAWSPHAPFGGYKRSGNGREYGIEGLEEYLETKAILGFQDGPAPSTAEGVNAMHAQRAGAIMTVALVLHRADGAPVSTSFRRAAFGKDDPFARIARSRGKGRTR